MCLCVTKIVVLVMHDYYWYHPYGWHYRHYGLYDGGAFVFFILLVAFVFIGFAACLPWDTSTYTSSYYNTSYRRSGYWKWMPVEHSEHVKDAKPVKDNKQHDTERLMF